MRFTASGLRAPAGRLRVYDTAHRLLGTAGMLARNGRLVGELWLPLGRATVIVSELESPGLRGILRTRHRLEPPARWTVHWLQIARPEALRERINSAGPLGRILMARIASEFGVRVDPVSLEHMSELDHLDLLRGATPTLQADPAIPMSTIAVVDDEMLKLPTVPLLLAGAGSDIVLFRSLETPGRYWWTAPDGSRVLAVSVPVQNNSDSLGFAASLDRMARGIEAVIDELPANPSVPPDIIVLDTDWNDADGLKSANARAWNRKYSYPAIAIGSDAELKERLADFTPAELPAFRSTWSARPAASAAELAASRERALSRRAAKDLSLFGALAAQLGESDLPTTDPKETIARHVRTPFDGFVVFNPTPVRRTEPVLFSDGREAIVTNIPPIGYAFIPSAALESGTDLGEPMDPLSSTSPLTAVGQRVSVELDEHSGAIRSLISGGDREWIRSGTDGFNAIPGALLERVDRQRIPAVGTRLATKRWSPAAGEVMSSVTLFDSLPWIEIHDTTVAIRDRPAECYFHFALDEPEVIWEVPGGHLRRRAPAMGITHLRWLALSDADGWAVIASDATGMTTVLDDATLMRQTSPGVSRHRLLLSARPLSTEELWEFGWLAEPLGTAKVDGRALGDLPRFGSLLNVDPPGTGIVGLAAASDGAGFIVWLMDMSGVGGVAILRWGLLGFEDAELVDFAERHVGPPPGRVEDGVLLYMPPQGALAVRLRGVGLNL